MTSRPSALRAFVSLWFDRFRTFLRRTQIDREMDAELRFHIEEQTRRNLAADMAPDESALAARQRFGWRERIREDARESGRARSTLVLESLMKDARFAARSLRKAPGFTIAIVATLAVGIGLVTAVFNVSQPVLFPDIPFPDADRLVVLRERHPTRDGYTAPLMPFRFASYAEHATSFAAVGAERLDSMNLVVDAEPYAVRASLVTEGFFATLGMSCQRGRSFAPEDFRADSAADVVVLSHRAWTSFCGRDPSIIGRDVLLGDRLRRVIGVLPTDFRFAMASGSTFGADGIYLPIAPEPVPENLYRVRGVNAVARLKSGVTLEQAQAELTTIHPEMPPNSTGFYTELEPWLVSLPDAFRENRAQPFRIFVGAVAFLYLIGCTSVTNLMLSRTVARRRELGVRIALGGTRGRVMALVLTEAVVLAQIGTLGAIVIAHWAQQLMTHLAPAGMGNGELLTHVFVTRTVVIAQVLSLATCVLSALIPAWHASRTRSAHMLKEGGGMVGDSRRLRMLRSTFVVLQGALAVALLIGAGLLIRSVSRLQHIDLGFSPDRKFVLTGTRNSSIDAAALEVLNRTIIQRIDALPGVSDAALTTSVPVVGNVTMGSMKLPSADGKLEEISCYQFRVSPDYFDVMEMPMLAGGGFANLGPGVRPVAVIDETTALQRFANQNPIGRFIVVGKDELEIVGVVRNVAMGYRRIMAMTQRGPITAQIYMPIWQTKPGRQLSAVVRMERDPGPEFAAMLRRAVYEIDPSIVLNVLPLEKSVADWSRTERHTLAMLQVLSALALCLAVFGMFSVMAYTVARRRGELALRLVLGATPRGLMRFVLARGFLLGLIGIGIGTGAALVLTRFLKSVLYETSPLEPLVFVAVALSLLAATLLACWLPARRAAKVDPIIALRAE